MKQRLTRWFKRSKVLPVYFGTLFAYGTVFTLYELHRYLA